MFVAWRLERVNVEEYGAAAAAAEALRLDTMARELEAMARVEEDHVEFFRSRLASRAAVTTCRPEIPRTP
jgi:hypothetical protein